MSIPHALPVKTGGFQAMTENPERGHLTYKVKNRKSPEGEEERAFPVVSGTRNVELRTARHIYSEQGGRRMWGEKSALGSKDIMGSAVLCDALRHRENLK